MSEQNMLQELYPGMRGFFVPGKFETKSNDKAQTPRQLFVQIGDDGSEKGTFFFDPDGKFTNMLGGAAIHDFIADPDTFDPRNPSGFDPDMLKILQSFRTNPGGLIDYARANPAFGIWKQETHK